MNPTDILFNSRRSPVFGTRGMAASSQPLASAAGVEVLARGGSAADAAVATAAALAVTEPMSTGLGGDCFMLYYDAATSSVSALNGSGRAPAALSIERLAREGITALPANHAYAVTVPGACAGWLETLARFGRLPVADVLAPAHRLASAGFPVAPLTAAYWDKYAGRLQGPSAGALLAEGRAPRAGQRFRNPALAGVLEDIAAGGAPAFYQGRAGQAIARAVCGLGGCLAPADLASHACAWEQPISTVYRNMRVWECPPNGQGLTALLALNILSGYDLAALPPLSPGRLHLLIEALRLAFADSRYYVADPSSNPAPLDWLLSDDYAAARRRLIDPRRAMPDPTRGMPLSGADTVYLSVVDGDSNACSFINSIYDPFGSGIVPQECGFALHNRGLNFMLDPFHPNALAAGKRPYHTIIPAMATHADGSLYACFGVMGGFMQPQGHTQVLMALLDDELDPQAALDRPRVCLRVKQPGGAVALEEGIPPETAAALAALGHPVDKVSGLGRELFGRGQIILRDPASGVLCAGSDPRADGCAIALA